MPTKDIWPKESKKKLQKYFLPGNQTEAHYRYFFKRPNLIQLISIRKLQMNIFSSTERHDHEEGRAWGSAHRYALKWAVTLTICIGYSDMLHRKNKWLCTWRTKKKQIKNYTFECIHYN
jgi:hypothetical protein